MNQRYRHFNRSARQRVWLWLALGWLGFGGIQSALAQSEDGLKAAFLYNFAKFTTWPAQTFVSKNAPIKIGFVGNDSLADKFEKSVAGKNINGQEFAVVRLRDATGVENCQIVFVGDAAAARAVAKVALGKPILTVCDAGRSEVGSGMISLFRQDAKIRFDIDLSSVKESQIKLDARLCQLARNLKS